MDVRMCGKSLRCSKLKLWKAKAITNLSEQELRKLVWLHWVYIFWSRCLFSFLGGGGRGEVSNLRIDRGLAVKPIYNQVRFIYVKSRFAFGQFGIF